MQTLPFSDDESPHITPKLGKKLPPVNLLHSSTKSGCSASVPINVSIYVFLFLYSLLLLLWLVYFIDFLMCL